MLYTENNPCPKKFGIIFVHILSTLTQKWVMLVGVSGCLNIFYTAVFAVFSDK